MSPTPRLDAELLLMCVCALSRAELITFADAELTPAEVRCLHDLVVRRRSGEPIAYLRGTREFWSMELTVSPATLIPRPETELLVKHALACIPLDSDCTIVDVGTGCGAIALALARERPTCRVIATDQAAAALAVARENARRHGLANVVFRQDNWLDRQEGENVDVIVSNPPYVSDQDPLLNSGDVRFEPVLARVAGPDGLAAIRHIIAHATSCLRSGGWLLLEHGYDQAASVTHIMRQCGYFNIATHEDLAGLDRVSKCQAPSGNLLATESAPQ